MFEAYFKLLSQLLLGSTEENHQDTQESRFPGRDLNPGSQYRDYATGWTTGVQFPEWAMMRIFLLTTASRPTLGSTQPPRLPETLSSEIHRLECEADHSPPSNAEV
jgi:hypothetical protein